MKQPRGRRIPPGARRLAAGRVSRVLGSLQLAVCLLPTLATVLFLGTIVESRHGRPAAADLVYRTWWFVLLLGLLAANIFCAALKKWPWQRHQTGFIITHIGLLTLIAGGVADSLLGITGSMALVSTADARFAGAGPQRSGVIVDRSAQRLRVRRPQRAQAEALDESFAPGPLAWGETAGESMRVDLLTRALSWLRDPLPDGWSRGFGDGSRLEVLTYYPSARLEPYGPADTARPGLTFPAAQFQLASAAAGVVAPRWTAFDPQVPATRLGPGRIDFLGQELRGEQIAEFRNPPSAAGARGQLIIGLKGQRYSIDMDRIGKSERLGDSNWTVEFHSLYGANGQPAARLDDGNAFFLVALGPPDAGAAKLTYRVWARGIVELEGPAVGEARAQRDLDVWLWYHPPDARLGDASTRAVLQFATDRDGQLHYRSFTSSRGGATPAFEGAGLARAEWQPVWAGMDWRFRVTKFLPRARAALYCTPVDRPASAEGLAEPPAVRCRLTHGAAAEEFWLARSDDSWTDVLVGGERFDVGYHSTRHELGFDLTLLRAEQVTDPASGKPAGLSSLVLVNDAAAGVRDEPYVITLNDPLSRHGYRIYQGGLGPLGADDAGRPVHRVQLLVNKDPGMYLKYAGSAGVALGIACMFTMRAYFFKRRDSAAKRS